MRLFAQALMLVWGICLITIPALKEMDGVILGNIWLVGSIIVGATGWKK